MNTRKRNQGISLPKSLLDDIARDGSSGHDTLHRHKNKKLHTSRKDARKQERLDRKKRKADHFSVKAASAKRMAEDEDLKSPESKRRKTVHFANDVDAPRPTRPIPSPRPNAIPSKPPQKSSVNSKTKTTALERLTAKSGSGPQRSTPRAPRTREEEEEDAYIAYLEAKLGYSQGGKRKKGDDVDGLGDLLDFAGSLELGTLVADSGSGSGSQGKDPDNYSDSDAESSPDDDISQSSQGDHDEGSEGGEWTGLGSSIDNYEGGHLVPQSLDPEPLLPAPSTERYVPPSLRKQVQATVGVQEDLVKLTRQLKGLINRMSEQNMSTVLDNIEEVYRNHRRHDVTSTLTKLIIDGIASHAMLLDSFVVLHAAFISSMHKLIGVEFAAFVVQNIVITYERHLSDVEDGASATSETTEDRGKECSNLIVLLSELYNFQVISCILVYDIIQDLLSTELSELRVELLLKILRSSGQQLRQDDPSALKDIVGLAQACIAKQGADLSSRTRFMMETLTNLKNNKIKKGATQHQGGDAVERMKKFLSGLGKKRHVHAHEPLRVSLADLHSAETKGKWWLVGAAWGGDPLVDQQLEASKGSRPDNAGDTSDEVLLKLAKKQGMNTDIRRSIFVVLMSSDDFLDACERLAQLHLSEVQQREIIRVVLHCSGNEKSYNPYHTLVAQHLCQTSHSYKITLQFCLWDFLRDLGETKVGGSEVIKSLKDEERPFDVKNVSSSRMKNVARAYGWWIAKDCCSLTVLKPMDFTLLKPQPRKFLKELFIYLFVASQTSSPLLEDHSSEKASRNRGAIEDIFMKATKIENLGLGLMYFLSNAFREEEGLLNWASSVARETLQTGMDGIPRI
ncbi:hypothetical protein F5I97DRAFT_2037366 [Phlebopus sp. FC_14]|nr:hypothetical protein F5I97DRAFT_2037366 [Phlebopus sp. FC_14]